MPQMLMITVKWVLLVGSFRIYDIEVFVNIFLSTFNSANLLRRLSSIHWQQTLYVLHVCKKSMDCLCMYQLS